MSDSQRHRRLIAEPLGEGLVLARQGGDRLFALNPTARFLWEALDGGAGEAALPDLLAGRFGLAPAVAARDVAAMLALWRAEALLPAAGRRQWRLALGAVEVGLACPPGPLAERLDALFGPMAGEAAAPLVAELAVEPAGERHRLLQDGRTLEAGLDADATIERLIASLAAIAAASLPWGLAVHAAAVADERGCLLLPAESRSGKSTLTAALLADPARRLLTDDFALLRPGDFAVHALGLPVVLKAGSWPALARLLPGLAEQPTQRRHGEAVRYWSPPAGQRTRTAQPIRALVLPRHLPGAAPRLEPIAPFDALARVIRAPAQTKAPLTAADLAALSAWFGGLPAWRLIFGEVEAALPLLAGL